MPGAVPSFPPSSPVPRGRPIFVAPHFVTVGGGAGLPGVVRRACAFTTAAPGSQGAATHRHHCLLLGGEGIGVQWRTETWPLPVQSGGPPALLSEGRAPDLPAAIAASLVAAHAIPGPEPATCVAPAFLALEREGGMPRIWVCALLSRIGSGPSAETWTEVQTAYIRERPGHDLPFQCSVERLFMGANTARHVTHCPAATLEEAVAKCEARFLATQGDA